MSISNIPLQSDMFTIARVLSFIHGHHYNKIVADMHDTPTDPNQRLNLSDFLAFVTDYYAPQSEGKTYGYINTDDPSVSLMVISPDNIPMISIQGMFRYASKMWDPDGKQDTITARQAYILLEVFDTYMTVMGETIPYDIDDTFFKRLIGDTYRTISNTIVRLPSPMLLASCNHWLSVDDNLIKPYEITPNSVHCVLFRLFILRHMQYASVYFNERVMDSDRIFPYYQLTHDAKLIDAISPYLAHITYDVDDRLRFLLSYISQYFSEHTPEQMLQHWFGTDSKVIDKCLRICHMVYLNVLDRLQREQRMPTDILFLESLTFEDCVTPDAISKHGA